MVRLSMLGTLRLLQVLFIGRAVAAQKEDGVLVLDSSNLDGALAEHQLLMLDFYAPWCGHCKQLEPEYAQAAKDLEGEGLVLGKIDCDANETLCEEDRWDIAAYPTIKVVRGGTTVHDYSGPGKTSDIARFMRQLALLDAAGNDDEGEEYYDDDDDYDEEWEEMGVMEEDGILLLAEHNFDAAAERFILMMVMFHNPAKSNSADVNDEYLAASEALYEFYIPLAKVDCFLQRELCQEARWNGVASDGAELPAIVAVRSGEVFHYDPRPRKAYNMVNFMKNLAGIGDDYYKEGASDDDDDEDDDVEEEEVNEKNVMTLDASTLDAALKDNKLLMVEFFAPWCGNCKRLRPRFARAADVLSNEGIPLAKIDCTENEALCLTNPWKIDRYPTLYVSRKGKLTLYEGKPERKAIISHMREMNRPRPQPLGNLEEFTAFLETGEIVVVGLFVEKKSKAFENFRALAEGDLSMPYGVSFDPEVRSKNRHESSDVIAVFKDYDQEYDEPPRVMMSVRSFTTKENMESFIRSTSKRLVLRMGSNAASNVLAKRPVAMFLFTEDEEYPSPSTLELIQMGRNLAKTGAHPMVYVHAPLDKVGEPVFDFVMGEKNRRGNVPKVAIVAPNGSQEINKFIYNGDDTTLEGLQEFTRRFFDGELKPYAKSEPLAETDGAGKVKVVKGQSFESIVMDNDDDVLVDFYAPWCPHCKRLAPVYDELAEKLNRREKLVIAKMDVSSNDIPHPTVTAKKLPTILLFKAHSKESPEKFTGEHEVASLEAFIDEKAFHKPAAPPDHSEL